ncbi:MAG TPA: polyphosphate kinase 1 [Bacteroidales bacterium]|nr:polyphosphate kinase 1 [Bacteroidales bacterium]HOL98898.1 polyphosphate kinase 1 [Bacteroidales bacterium]HOM37202.1 polyphosphate kinase 1 [Bacteroidales bacterium]HPD24125.1 polyphosphate kinase 1 [Bacteroidales bacterium]HRS99301.1 polyphosphate kinase 1 [Bacteroidales bacterium]
MKFLNREISWLYFNSRLIQEALNPEVPLLERIRFLGIYSNNLDEFYKVRVASLLRLMEFNKKNYPEKVKENEQLLNSIYSFIQSKQIDFNRAKEFNLKELEKKGVFLVNETELNNEQRDYLINYFHENILSILPIIRLTKSSDLSNLSDGSIYLGIILRRNNLPDVEYALIQIPTGKLPRFIEIPSVKRKKYIIYLDDVIRLCLKDIFGKFGYDSFEAYTVKITRDSEIDYFENSSKSIVDLISESVKKRKTGTPVRFIYDSNMPEPLINILMNGLKIKKKEQIVKGYRYHNSRDFMKFPNVLGEKFIYKSIDQIPHRDIDNNIPILDSIKKKDILFHFPYNSFDYILRLLKECSIDPRVRSIKITLYRLAEDSKVISALVNAAQNGKSVTVFLELKARFEEEHNIYLTQLLEEAGVKIIKTIPGIKVHSKLILIRTKENKENFFYTNISTGNFNEITAKIYSDLSLLTADQRIAIEVGKVFYLMESAYRIINFEHLIVSPLYARTKFIELVENEIHNAKQGKEAWIDMKLNSFTDPTLVEKFKEAVESGVKVRISARASCSLVHKNNPNLKTIGIVDKFLEHSRFYIFCNGGENLYYISSSDIMIRNLDTRIEVTAPIYNKELQKELRDIFEIQMNDNTKARDWGSEDENTIVNTGKTKIRTQFATYEYLKKLNKKAL